MRLAPGMTGEGVVLRRLRIISTDDKAWPWGGSLKKIQLERCKGGFRFGSFQGGAGGRITDCEFGNDAFNDEYGWWAGLEEGCSFERVTFGHNAFKLGNGSSGHVDLNNVRFSHIRAGQYFMQGCSYAEIDNGTFGYSPFWYCRNLDIADSQWIGDVNRLALSIINDCSANGDFRDVNQLTLVDTEFGAIRCFSVIFPINPNEVQNILLRCRKHPAIADGEHIVRTIGSLDPIYDRSTIVDCEISIEALAIRGTIIRNRADRMGSASGLLACGLEGTITDSTGPYRGYISPTGVIKRHTGPICCGVPSLDIGPGVMNGQVIDCRVEYDPTRPGAGLCSNEEATDSTGPADMSNIGVINGRVTGGSFPWLGQLGGLARLDGVEIIGRNIAAGTRPQMLADNNAEIYRCTITRPSNAAGIAIAKSGPAPGTRNIKLDGCILRNATIDPDVINVAPTPHNY